MHESIKSRLFIAEAVSIALKRPTLNAQAESDSVLPSCRSRPDVENPPIDDAPVVDPPAVDPPVVDPPVADLPVVVDLTSVDPPVIVDLTVADPPTNDESEAVPRAAQRHVRQLRPLPHRSVRRNQ